MKVKDLIQKLSELDPELEVVCEWEDEIEPVTDILIGYYAGQSPTASERAYGTRYGYFLSEWNEEMLQLPVNAVRLI